MVPSLRRFTLTLPLLCSALFGAQYYYVSFRIVADRGLVALDRLRLSKMMTPPAGHAEKMCEIFSDADTFADLVRRESDALLDCLSHENTVIRSYQKSLDNILVRDKTVLIVPPMPLQVEFNDGLAIIYKVRSEK